MAKLLGNSVLGATVDRRLAGRAPDSITIYQAMRNLYFASIEAFQNSLGLNAYEIMADIPNSSNLAPVIQIREAMI